MFAASTRTKTGKKQGGAAPGESQDLLRTVEEMNQSIGSESRHEYPPVPIAGGKLAQ